MYSRRLLLGTTRQLSIKPVQPPKEIRHSVYSIEYERYLRQLAELNVNTQFPPENLPNPNFYIEHERFQRQLEETHKQSQNSSNNK